MITEIELNIIGDEIAVSVQDLSLEFDFGDGMDGAPGWSPVFSIEADGARRVLKVVDWVGSWGVMPAVDVYVGLTGFVSNIADGVDIRGPAGGGGGGGGYTGPFPEFLNNDAAVFAGITIGDTTNGIYRIAEGSDVAPKGSLFQVY